MKTLFRSIIDFGNVKIDRIRENYTRFADSSLDFTDYEIESQVAQFIHAFVRKYKGEVPSKQTVMEYFASAGRPEIVNWVESLEEEPVHIGANFIAKVDEAYEIQKDLKFEELLARVATIKANGLELKQGSKKSTLKGMNDAVRHFISEVSDITKVKTRFKVSGTFNEDKEEALQEYTAAKLSPPLGELMGLSEIDKFTRGQKKGELMLIGGFTGELKTTLALNYAWLTAFWYGRNVYYGSLEMPYPQVRRIVAALHSTHPQFTVPTFKDGRKNPKFNPHAPLSYTDMRDGSLTPEKEALLELVWKDIDEGTKKGLYGCIEIDRPTDDSDNKVTVNELRFRAEKFHVKHPLSLIIIDHGGLVDFEGGRKAGATGEALNFVLRDASKMALNFDGGEGIAVCMPFQINRQGKREAEKNDGVYKIDALSYANEAERSASIIITTYLDDTLRGRGEVKIGCLKNRDNPLFQPFTASIDWPSRRIRSNNGANTRESEVDLDGKTKTAGDAIDQILAENG